MRLKFKAISECLLSKPENKPLKEEENNFYGPLRILEIGGKIVFHAPYLLLDKKAYNAEDVEISYDMAVASILKLFKKNLN